MNGSAISLGSRKIEFDAVGGEATYAGALLSSGLLALFGVELVTLWP